jgi:hypothetical protein
MCVAVYSKHQREFTFICHMRQFSGRTNVQDILAYFLEDYYQRVKMKETMVSAFPNPSTAVFHFHGSHASTFRSHTKSPIVAYIEKQPPVFPCRCSYTAQPLQS